MKKEFELVDKNEKVPKYQLLNKGEKRKVLLCDIAESYLNFIEVQLFKSKPLL